ncbi:radical SAM protein [Pseudomonas luteola]
MTTEIFRKIFDQIESLYDLDRRLEEIEWEAIGGETTMMPFAWWEENLPWALERISKINKKIGKAGSLNFLTNLVYSDKRYTDLINQYANHPAFCLYTSWEPDTGRFGKNNKLFPKFLKTLESIKADKKILDVILTKKVIEMGPEYLVDTFVSRGITDFSIKMLSPYGSGKDFFKWNMVDFDSMSEFLLKLDKIKPQHVTYTPQDEMMGSIHAGSSFQCNGNFQYDLAIEPDGTCTFNANQTANEASLGSRTIHINDPLWSSKVMYENKREENQKLTLEHPACEQCEFMRFCNAGWYHYKIHNPDEIRLFDRDECAGYKKVWLSESLKMGGSKADISMLIHTRTKSRLSKGEVVPQERARNLGETINESDLPKGYDEFFQVLKNGMIHKPIRLDMKRKFGKSLSERIWFYESYNLNVCLESLETLSADIVEHWLYRNYKNVHIPNDLILEWLSCNVESRIARYVTEIMGIANGQEAKERILYLDARNEELFRSLIDMRIVNLDDVIKNLKAEEAQYFLKLKLLMTIEQTYVA